ncbi:MAG: hypothetical protein LBI70_03435 [Rickettsiales bacterium]|jgi:hypothetical protein|nr:hypothetical protein [Rickettsiales bacterium]
MKTNLQKLTALLLSCSLLSSLLLGGIFPALAGSAVERVEVDIASKEEVDIAGKKKELEDLGLFSGTARGAVEKVEVAVADKDEEPNEESNELEFSSLADDGNPNYKLIQTEGSLNSDHHTFKGIYEYIINDKGQITHERFVKDGKITGTVGGGTGGGTKK